MENLDEKIELVKARQLGNIVKEINDDEDVDYLDTGYAFKVLSDNGKGVVLNTLFHNKLKKVLPTMFEDKGSLVFVDPLSKKITSFYVGDLKVLWHNDKIALCKYSIYGKTIQTLINGRGEQLAYNDGKLSFAAQNIFSHTDFQRLPTKISQTSISAQLGIVKVEFSNDILKPLYFNLNWGETDTSLEFRKLVMQHKRDLYKDREM